MVFRSRSFLACTGSLLIIFYLKSAFTQYHQYAGQQLASKKRKLVVLRSCIAVLSFASYCCSHLLLKPQPVVNAVQTLLIIAYLAVTCVADWVRDEQQSRQNGIFLVMNFLSLFMGPHFPVILGVTLWVEKQVHCCYNYAVLMGVLAKCVWWWLGNRYEYSGVDILKTYVYSESYITVLNGISLMVYLVSPFILVFTLLNARLLSRREEIETELVKYDTGYNWDRLDPQASQSMEQVASQDARQAGRQFLDYLYSCNLKYGGMLMMGLVSSICNTLLNNGLQMFSYYASLLAFDTLLTLTVFLMALLASLYHSRRLVCCEYSQLSLNS